MAEGSDNRHTLKRMRVASSDEEATCQKCDTVVQESIISSGCKLNYCLKCAQVSQSLFDIIHSGELENFMWSCRSCRATFPSLENITSVVQDIQKKSDVRMSILEERMSSIENQSQYRISECLSNVKQEILEKLKGDINDMVDVRTKEMEERKRRENNLVLFNLLEHRENSGLDNKRKDEDDVRSLCASLGLENVNLLTTFRLGKKIPSRTRPLKIVLEIKSHKKYLMDNAKFVSSKTP